MPDNLVKSTFKMSAEDSVGRIDIDGPIGWGWWDEPNSYEGFKKALADLGDVNVIEIHLQSPGGVITDGTAMANLLRAHKAEVHTFNEGEAGSMASVLLLAGDKVHIPDNAMTFIHKPLNMVVGNADAMRKQADELDKFEKAIGSLYKKNFKGSDDELTALMASETWYTAAEMADKFDNVTVIDSGGQKAAATSEPMAIWALEDENADLTEQEASLLRRILNKFGKKEKQASPKPKEVDMPLSKEEMQEIAQMTATSMVSALNDGGFIAKKEEQEVPDKPAPKAEAIPFEGDLTNEEEVQAHAEKLRLSEVKASVDWSDYKSVAAYHKEAFGAEKQTPAPSNITSPEGTRGATTKDDLTSAQVSAKSDELRARAKGVK